MTTSIAIGNLINTVQTCEIQPTMLKIFSIELIPKILFKNFLDSKFHLFQTILLASFTRKNLCAPDKKSSAGYDGYWWHNALWLL